MISLCSLCLPFECFVFKYSNFRGSLMKDAEIWRYAKSGDMTIVTKDSDFIDRIIISEPPPRIIHFQPRLCIRICSN